ncbi:ABC transporter ATP-binding protein [Desulfovibrio sp. Fe33]|uniref:ABC transporter ATP-binding protein n=1 Tax=Desulfovibrio sp. Fe33 TaxID=3020842 RepID=UPI00234D10B7|nr:ABC transporter ATP-binding protein [Desulfovibrio sp. Fe33]
MSAIHFHNLTIQYGATTVIDRLSLDIEDGSFFVLLGASGCGKTTLLRTIAGFIKPTSGNLYFDDRDLTHVPAHLRNIGFVFQDHALFPNLTVHDNIAYGLKVRKFRKKSINAEVMDIATKVGLGDLLDRFPSELSGGQQQRVALARALVVKPSVLLMDEPLSSLDCKLRIEMRSLIAEIQREIGTTTVLVTHDQEEALELATDVAVIRKGAIEQLGTPRDVYAKPQTAFVADFIGAANILDVESMRLTPENRICCALSCGQDIHIDNDQEIEEIGGTKLIVRPEDILVATRPAPGIKQLEGRVVQVRYHGRSMSYLVKLAEDQFLVVDDALTKASGEIAQGSRVYATLPASLRCVRS